MNIQILSVDICDNNFIDFYYLLLYLQLKQYLISSFSVIEEFIDLSDAMSKDISRKFGLDCPTIVDLFIDKKFDL